MNRSIDDVKSRLSTYHFRHNSEVLLAAEFKYIVSNSIDWVSQVRADIRK